MHVRTSQVLGNRLWSSRDVINYLPLQVEERRAREEHIKSDLLDEVLELRVDSAFPHFEFCAKFVVSEAVRHRACTYARISSWNSCFLYIRKTTLCKRQSVYFDVFKI